MKVIIGVLATLILLPQMVLASDQDAGFRFATVTPTNDSVLHVENVIRGGKAWDLDLVRKKGKYKEQNKVLNQCFANAPGEQYPEDHYAGSKNSTPPSGYERGGVIGWMIAVNNGAGEGSVLLRALRIFGIDQNGTRHLITDEMICEECDIDNQIWGYDMPRSLWRTPGAWSRPNHGAVFQMLDSSVIRIPTSDQPLDLFHLWNTVWPRPAVEAGWSYEAEAEVLPQGAGMIQLGLDFWSQRGDGGTNVEAAHSSWICSKADSNDWITVRVGGTR